MVKNIKNKIVGNPGATTKI